VLLTVPATAGTFYRRSRSSRRRLSENRRSGTRAAYCPGIHSTRAFREDNER
jgi:hypothetical protein